MTVQDVIDACSTDYRQVLSNASPDSLLFITWVDRIHKDALHTGMYNPLIQLVSNVSVVSGTSSYAIPVTSGAIRRIQLVYDRTFDRILTPIEGLVYPTFVGDASSPRQPLQLPEAMLSASTQIEWPQYYKREGLTGLIIFPAPQKTAFNGTYEIHYEMQVPDLTSTTDTLLIPDDGIDQVVAGVNSYIGQYLHLDQEGQFWTQQYETLKRGIATT